MPTMKAQILNEEASATTPEQQYQEFRESHEVEWLEGRERLKEAIRRSNLPIDERFK